MKKNIVVLCADKNVRTKMAKKIAELLEMIFVDANDLVNYELIDAKNMIEKAGLEYFALQRDRIIKRIFSFENTVISMDSKTLNEIPNYDQLKLNSIVLFLKLNEISESTSQSISKINQVALKDRQKYLEQKSDITIILNDKIISKNVKIVMESLKNSVK